MPLYVPNASPQHGFFAVQIVFCLYVATAVGMTYGLWALGVAADAAGVAFVLVSAALLPAFWPLFRRLHPERSGSE